MNSDIELIATALQEKDAEIAKLKVTLSGCLAANKNFVEVTRQRDGLFADLAACRERCRKMKDALAWCSTHLDHGDSEPCEVCLKIDPLIDDDMTEDKKKDETSSWFCKEDNCEGH